MYKYIVIETKTFITDFALIRKGLSGNRLNQLRNTSFSRSYSLDDQLKGTKMTWGEIGFYKM